MTLTNELLKRDQGQMDLWNEVEVGWKLWQNQQNEKKMYYLFLLGWATLYI